ncbi:hypothetical protein GUJ93_ZPchr0012g21138 [Zizania palustris]|uniref:Uncharacterized protein n=1 Tax=Zizania palustris TaxID=103762 RepID=A0A8J5WK80_ZIZPA|nr:hypothetical protein GUJ93_ZPchr0012g21138 [Zizania palustris]
MDSGHSSRRQRRLGLKVTPSPTSSAPPAASFSSPPPTVLPAPPGPPSSSLAARAPAAVAPSPAPSSSPTGGASSPLQENQHAPDLWMKAKHTGFSSVFVRRTIEAGHVQG